MRVYFCANTGIHNQAHLPYTQTKRFPAFWIFKSSQNPVMKSIPFFTSLSFRIQFSSLSHSHPSQQSPTSAMSPWENFFAGFPFFVHLLWQWQNVPKIVNGWTIQFAIPPLSPFPFIVVKSPFDLAHGQGFEVPGAEMCKTFVSKV